MRKKIMAVLFLLAVFTQEGYGADAGKSQYNLIAPVLKQLMRAMSTDRPDKTESPYTVDAGHYQIETSLIDYTYDARNDEISDARADSISVFPTNFKAGLLNNVDLQLVIDPYIREHSQGDGEKEIKRGFGDIQTRLKVNLWGNDGGTTALAVMPFVKFPTNTDQLGNTAVEGGIIVPLAVSLSGDWGMGIMTEFDFSRNTDKDYYVDFINTITFSHQIIGDLSGYVEFFSAFNNQKDSSWVGTVDTGMTYALSSDVQLDGGINIGVTNSADDFNPFMGFTVRY